MNIGNVKFDGGSPVHHEREFVCAAGQAVSVVGFPCRTKKSGVIVVRVAGAPDPKIAILASLARFEEEDGLAASHFGDFVDCGSVSSSFNFFGVNSSE